VLIKSLQEGKNMEQNVLLVQNASWQNMGSDARKTL